MFAATIAAIPALEVVGFGEDHVALFVEVKILGQGLGLAS
jgi:hypothetical protein